MSIVRKSTAKKAVAKAPVARKGSGAVSAAKGLGSSRKPIARKVYRSVEEPTHFSRDEILSIVSAAISK